MAFVFKIEISILIFSINCVLLSFSSDGECDNLPEYVWVTSEDLLSSASTSRGVILCCAPKETRVINTLKATQNVFFLSKLV